MRFPRRDCKLFRTVKRSNGRAARTWRTAIAPVLIVQAIFCDGSACCLQPKQLQSIRSKCSERRAGWTGCSKMSTPSSAVLERVRVERCQIYLTARRHAGRMARAMATRADGRRRRKLVLRLTHRYKGCAPVSYFLCFAQGPHRASNKGACHVLQVVCSSERLCAP